MTISQRIISTRVIREANKFFLIIIINKNDICRKGVSVNFKFTSAAYRKYLLTSFWETQNRIS